LNFFITKKRDGKKRREKKGVIELYTKEYFVEKG